MTRLTLNRLGRAHVGAIIKRLAGDRPIDERLVDEVVSRTDGVPLFVEELTKATLDSDTKSIPASLHDSLMARLDRVPDVRDVAQAASVIGRVFDHGLLAEIAGQGSTGLEGSLDRLIDAELVYRRGKPPDATYTFKHALVRDAAYESLLKSRRQELHGIVAHALQERAASGGDFQTELLAHHYCEAGRWKESIENWLLAGNRAARRAANREAVGHVRRGLDLIEKLPDSPATMELELELVLTLSGCLRALEGWNSEATVNAVQRAQALSDRLEGNPHVNSISIGVYTVHLMRGELTETEQFGRELLNIARRSGSNLSAFVGHRACGVALFSKGDFPEARTHLELALSSYDPDMERETVQHLGYYSGASLHSYLGHVLWHLGYPDLARKHVRSAVDLAVRLQHLPTQAFAWFQAAYHCGPLIRNDLAALGIALESYRNIVGDRNYQVFSRAIGVFDTWARPDDPDALANIDETIEWWKGNVGKLVVPGLLLVRAGIQHRIGSTEGALRTVDESIDWMFRFEERCYLPEAHRYKGDLLGSLPKARTAEQVDSYRKAMEVAREQRALTMELRAATSLARVCAEHRDRGAAREPLAALYSRFTEGFDTSDLTAAARLLEKLS